MLSIRSVIETVKVDLKTAKKPVSDDQRAMLGLVFGVLVMAAVVSVFTVNSFDHDNMARGVRLILSGVNPWAIATRIPHYYNPPFGVLFLWPLLYLGPRALVVIGGGLLAAFAFRQRAWVGLAFFLTNSFLFVVAMGGVDMALIGGGLLALLYGDKLYSRRAGLLLRVLGYGLLLVKPQGGLFIVLLYVLMRRDWKGVLLSALVYGLPFITLYPDWLRVLLTDPPLAQTVASHTITAKYGWLAALLLAAAITPRRAWPWWGLGAALAQIMAPYGMPGVPIFLILCSVGDLAAAPAVVVFSALLAGMTWVNPPAGVEFHSYSSTLMGIYHVAMLLFALVLACFARPHPTIGEIDLRLKKVPPDAKGGDVRGFR